MKKYETDLPMVIFLISMVVMLTIFVTLCIQGGCQDKYYRLYNSCQSDNSRMQVEKAMNQVKINWYDRECVTLQNNWRECRHDLVSYDLWLNRCAEKYERCVTSND